MALRNQPYLPLYVQDFLTDEKLIECSASATGVYIRLMCIMHKSDEYGKILLKQKDKQNSSNILNFASKLSKQMPYQTNEIESALTELITEGVIHIEGDVLFQKRMVHDNSVSNSRAVSGQKGGVFAQAKIKANIQAKSEASTEYENEYESKNVSKGGAGGNFTRGDILPFPELKAEILSSDAWIEQTAIHFHITKNKCLEWLNQFLSEIELKNDYYKPVTEIRSYFVNWYKKQPKTEQVGVYTPPPTKQAEKFPDMWDENYYDMICVDVEGYADHLRDLGFTGQFNKKRKRFEFVKP